MAGQRIVIIGNSTSGKTTLGEHIAAARCVPFIELDALYWDPDWTPVDPAIFLKRVHQAIESPAWVLAGNYAQQQGISWPAADTVVWLDLPLPRILYRIIKRSWRRWRSRELLWGTNYERFWTQLKLWDTEESLITYTVMNHRRRRKKYAETMGDPAWSHLSFVRLRSTAEIEKWLTDSGILAESRSALT